MSNKLIREVDKYGAEIFKIVGFAFMSPFGRIIVQPSVVFNELSRVAFIFYIIFSLFLFFVGLMVLIKGYEILGLIVFPFSVAMIAVAILWNKFARNVPRDKKK